MENYYLKTVTVPVPKENNPVVIRKGERVEYELERTYLPEKQNTRVKRKVIGKVDPIQPGRMFPDEAYFELFPENEVPEAVRDEFLRECAIKRKMSVIRRNPAEVIDGVVRGIEIMNAEFGNRKGRAGGDGAGYAMLRRVFDEIYYATEEMASKFPNKVMDPFKVEMINEVLEGLRAHIQKEWSEAAEQAAGRGALCADSRTKRTDSRDAAPADAANGCPVRYLRLIEEGLTYSDAFLLMKWYKVLPR